MGKTNSSGHINLATAWNTIRAHGGEVYVDAQETVITSSQNFASDPSLPYVPCYLRGDGSSRLKINVGTPTGNNAFNIGGNLTKIVIANLTFLANHPTDLVFDCFNMIETGGSDQYVHIHDIEVGGIGTYGSVIKATGGLLLENAIISGGMHQLGAIQINQGITVVIRKLICHDYHNYRNVYYSKTPNGILAWIQAINPFVGYGIGGKSSIVIEDSHFDEGGTEAIVIDGYAHASIKRVKINNHGLDTGIGIKLNNVKEAVLEGCHSGLYAGDTGGNPNATLAKFTNCGDVWIRGFTQNANNVKIKADRNSRIHLDGLGPKVIIERI